MHQRIHTEHFSLATYYQGDRTAQKIAIVLPGRLDTKDYPHMQSLVDFLAIQGYFALSFDPPGTWESPGSIDLYTTTNYLKAINEIIVHFGNRPTLLLGHSRGGTLAMLASSNAAVRGIVAIMASYGAPSPPRPEEIKIGFQRTSRDVPGTSNAIQEKKFLLPLNYFTDGKKYDPIAVLRRCVKPKLLIYGVRDEFTNPERIKEIYATIPPPKMIHELDSDHDYRWHPKIIKEVNTVIGKFLTTI